MAVINSNVSGAKPVLFSSNNETITINPNVVVFATTTGVDSGVSSGNTLINRGDIISDGRGVWLYNNSRVNNTAVGEIVALGAAIELDQSPLRSAIVNAGQITSFATAIVFGATANGVSLNNSGSITGVGAAVQISSGLDGGTITNSGKLIGRNSAIFIGGGSADPTEIINLKGGLIQGGAMALDAAISCNASGAIALQNLGTITGNVRGGFSVDTVVNNGKITGNVDLSMGADTYRGTGQTTGMVFGGAGNDRLTGGAKADRLAGGMDKDILTGKAGADRFHFANFMDSQVGANRDVITDFRHDQHDRINLADMSPGTFVFRGMQDLVGSGTPSVRYFKQNPAGTAKDKTIVEGDADGNGFVDFQIELKGLHNLVAADFVL